jgi:hypothetical protein
VEALETALIDCDHDLTALLAGALWAISPDPEGDRQAFFQHRDKELGRLARQALKEHRPLAQLEEEPPLGATVTAPRGDSFQLVPAFTRRR